MDRDKRPAARIGFGLVIHIRDSSKTGAGVIRVCNLEGYCKLAPLSTFCLAVDTRI